MGSNGTRLLLLLLLLNVAGYASQTKKLIIYFGKDKDYITNGEAEKLQALKNADYVMLTGHTDNDGGDSFNMDLSKRRVERVKAFIQNISKDIKIETNYYGETQPVNKNANEEEKTMNRRVEIAYISNPLLSLEVPKNEYKVDNSKDQTIKCPHGTEVIIPAGAFNNQKVNITVSEYYNPDEIFAANLTTTSNNSPLETAGMIYITADANGLPVEPSKALEFKFPRQNKETGFKIFSGVRDSALNINWVFNTPRAFWQMRTVSTGYRATSTFQYDTFPLRRNENDFSFSENYYTVNWDDNNVQYFYKKLYAFVRGSKDTSLNNLNIDITFNKGGAITSVKDNYSNTDSAAHEAFRKQIYACLPMEFKPHGTNAQIHVGFFQGTQSTYNYYMSLFSCCYNGFIFLRDPPGETDAIVLNSSNLGWINCDRFLTGPKLQAFNVEADTGANVRLVLKKYRSFFGTESFADARGKNGEITSRTFTFNNIPANEDVLLISTKKIDGTIYLAIQDSKTTRDGGAVKFNYKSVSKEELAEAIRSLKI